MLCGSLRLRGDLSSVCPQLSRCVLEKGLFVYSFLKREQRCLAAPAAPALLVFCSGVTDHTSCSKEGASCKVLLQCEKERMVFPSAACALRFHMISVI